jgi:hypothetical protein
MCNESVFHGEPLQEKLGRFWAIAGDSEDEEEDAGGSPLSLLSASMTNYLCGSPTPIQCDLQIILSSSLKRKERKQRMQRETTVLMRGMDSSPSNSFTQNLSTGASPVEKRLPVLSPTTFFLETFNAKEWIQVQRRRRKVRLPPSVYVGEDPNHRRRVRWQIIREMIVFLFQTLVDCAKWAIIVPNYSQVARWALPTDLGTSKLISPV